MHTTSHVVATVEQTAAAVPAATTSLDIKPVNHSNGPQCASCGWRGGNHACFELSLQVNPTQMRPGRTRRVSVVFQNSHFIRSPPV
ncbi:hypothetical protein B0H17DRAFT_1338720 [Mycena rosella]|uniref:Uncharacterized protein n=1 Tax=Mycena rosella TaxID=1033263 RepID=A0AAD7CHK4_MYCRO|nr:hypothetical protein B0H17DRAFT_1338720 [Mycena rosella]